jgi:hypothetical protein
MRIFLSCVSAQLRECRDTLASDLRAIGCEVRVQEDFQQGTRTLLERLQEYVAGCERVVALVGDAYGSEAVGPVPALAVPRSYTQWEVFFALGERLEGPRAEAKDLYLYFYFASDQFLGVHPVAQSGEHAERQRSFRAQVQSTGMHWGSFDSVDYLCRQVLRDGWQMNARPRRPCNLPYASLGTLFKGRDEILSDEWRPRRRPHVSRAPPSRWKRSASPGEVEQGSVGSLLHRAGLRTASEDPPRSRSRLRSVRVRVHPRPTERFH